MGCLFRLQHVGPAHEFGQFGTLLVQGIPILATLERTYEVDGAQITKIPPGIYHCTRTWFVKGGYETFEIGVPGHSRILFHVGNTEEDSDGCVLVAMEFGDLGVVHGIIDSRKGFEKFMALTEGRGDFDLEVA